MKKSVRNKGGPKGDPETDLREILRQFARTVLYTQKLRETAAKKIGSKPSYIRAMLDQRGVGGLSTWSALMMHCFDVLGVDLLALLGRALQNPERLKEGSALSSSELVFRNLDQISIVNEDVKFQLATHLEKMLKDLENSIESRGKRA